MPTDNQRRTNEVRQGHGDWYRRGYFDDGSPLGSISSDECRIDSIAQSWGVISGAADRERSLRAMAAVDGQLVSRADALIRLFTPAFDHSKHDPGYVKGYPAGLRENGGQYTHGVSWLVDALVRLSLQAGASGDVAEATRLRRRAVETWFALSPIAYTMPETFDRFGLAPHQQAADVYVGPSHGGRGGWSWYTGGAGRMLSAAHAILGLRLEQGELVLPDDLFAPKGGLQLESLTHRGRIHRRG